jgi:type I restriction enzyme S subunit
MSERWLPARLSDFVEIAIGGTPSRSMPSFWAEKPAGQPWLAISDLRSKYVDDTREHISDLGVRSSNVKLIPAGSTVMSFKLSVGRTAITTQPLYSNEAIAAFLPRSDAVSSAWLYHVLPRAAGTVVTDSAVKGATLNKAKMAEMTVLLPSPVEQRTISQILDTLDTTIRQTEAIIEKLKQVKQGLLHDLLTRGIDANGELRPPQSEAPHLYKKSPLGWIPRAWNTTTLAALTSIRSGTTPARRAAARYYRAGGTPWVKTLDLNEDIIYSTDEHITDAALRECSCEELPVGTVLVAMYGGWQQIGRSAMLGMPAATNQAISALVFGSGGPHPEYVLRAVQQGRPRWGAVAASTRKDPNITKSDVAEFRIPLPLEFEEQVRIAETVRALLTRIDCEHDAVSKLMQEKTGLMDDLLTGRVRVTPLLA